MAVIDDDIAALYLIEIIIALILSAACPHSARQVALLYARLVKAPVYEAGAIEDIGAFAASDIAAAELASCNADKVLDACRCIIAAAVIVSSAVASAIAAAVAAAVSSAVAAFADGACGTGCIIGEEKIHGISSDLAIG